MGCGHLCLCSDMALLSWVLCWALGSMGGSGKTGAVVETGKMSLRFTICIHSHLGPCTTAESLDLCSWQSNPMIPVNQRLSRGENSGLRWDQEEERRIWSLSDGLSHLYWLRLGREGV